MPAKRRIDPDFEIEPWLGALIDYCVSGGPRPAMRAGAETPEPTRSYEPPKPAPSPRTARVKNAAPPPPPPPPPRRHRQPRRPPPPKEKTWRELLDEARRIADEARRRVEEDERRRRSYQPYVPAAFQMLGSPYPTTSDLLRAHWRRLVFKHHPDRGGDLGHFLKLKAAYDEAEGICEGRPITLRWPPT